MTDLTSWVDVPANHPFPIQNLPLGVFRVETQQQAHIGMAIGEQVLDLTVLAARGFFECSTQTAVLQEESLNALMREGRELVRLIRERVQQLLSAGTAELRDNAALKAMVLHPMETVTLLMPVEIGGYTDFYSSKGHASNLGTMFRGPENVLPANWLHIPVGYDGRAASVVVSGTGFHRPKGQVKATPEAPPAHKPTSRLDVEVEVGFFVGKPSSFGDAIDMEQAPEHLFGMVLVNDWSARDIQKWEYVPLGPFLGKNFATSISPWVVTFDALEPFRVKGPKQDPKPLDYLERVEDWNLDIQLELLVQTPQMETPAVISSMPFKDMYWDPCQQLAHHSMNGCPMHTGDLLASGTVSGTEPGTFGSLIELTWAGRDPIALPNGETRTFLEDGDTVIIRGFCQGNGYRVGFGEVRGTVLPAR